MPRSALLLLLAGAFLLSACGPAAADSQPAKNETLQTIFDRVSVRKYTPQPVQKDTLDLLVRAAMAAPTGKNVRPWSFVIVTNRATLDKLSEKLPNARMLAQAGQAIVVCGDTTASDLWMLDCAAATENLLLAAQSLGLGAVWTAAWPYPERVAAVRECLQLPKNIMPLNVVPLGYPLGREVPKEKYDPSRIHYDRWTSTQP